jgi:hypothetical protein
VFVGRDWGRVGRVGRERGREGEREKVPSSPPTTIRRGLGEDIGCGVAWSELVICEASNLTDMRDYGK